MHRISYAWRILVWFTLFVSLISIAHQCEIDDRILQCDIDSGSSLIDVTSFSSRNYDSIQLKYKENAILNLVAPATAPISILPKIEYPVSTLQISYLNTGATSVNININLTPIQSSIPLFTGNSNVTARSSTIRINVVQQINNAQDFKLFDTSSLSNLNLRDFELIVNSNKSVPDTLNLPNLIRRLINTWSITISGSNHYLAVHFDQLPTFENVNQLSFKNLQLYERVLDKFIRLKAFSIEQCTYNKTAMFLQSSQIYNISLKLNNNNPLDGMLPQGTVAFQNLANITSLTLIEPKLNSTCLKALNELKHTKAIIIELSSYEQSHFTELAAQRLLTWFLTVNNIKDLNIFPSKFFNKFDALQKLTLQGTFRLKKSDICVFTGFNLKLPPDTQTIILNTLNTTPSPSHDLCAVTYLKAILIRSFLSITCLPDNTPNDCARWANETAQCDLTSFEKTCPGETTGPYPFFYQNGSYLYEFFNRRLWLTSTTTTKQTTSSDGSSMNIGAIVGALCGLLIAVIVFGMTVFCIHRYRQAQNIKTNSARSNDYKPSSLDPERVSIATSKSSQSSNYPLQNSFFPPMQPNDQVAPPLYSAPSESVGYLSAYRLPTAPRAPRGSVSTRATHVYETLDN